MNALVASLGFLALVSGLAKLMGRSRTLPGVPLFALLEVVAGGAVPLLVLSHPPSPAHGLLLMALTLGLVFLSTGFQVLRTRADRHRRQATENARLVTYVRYLSKEGGAPPPSTRGNGEGR